VDQPFSGRRVTTDRPLVTVVVVSWDGAHLLPQALDGLAAQDIAGGLVTVVVDNGSVDGTAELLSRHYPWVQVVTSDRNLGFAGGANLGLETAQTPYAVVLNNDARPEPSWLRELLAGFDADNIAAVTSKVLLEPRFVALELAGPGVELMSATAVLAVRVADTAVTGQVVVRADHGSLELLVPAPSDGSFTVELTVRDVKPGWVLGLAGSKEPTLSLFPSGTVSMDLPAGVAKVDVLNSTGGYLTRSGHGADRGYLEVDRGQYDGAPDVFAACGAAAAFRTDVGRSAGWFDAWLFAYYEDLDLSWRLRSAGWQVRYAPRAVVRHQHAATSRVGSDFFVYHNVRNRLVVLTRHLGLVQTLRLLATRRTVGARAIRQLSIEPSEPFGLPLNQMRIRLLAIIAAALRLVRCSARRHNREHALMSYSPLDRG